MEKILKLLFGKTEDGNVSILGFEIVQVFVLLQSFIILCIGLFEIVRALKEYREPP